MVSRRNQVPSQTGDLVSREGESCLFKPSGTRRMIRKQLGNILEHNELLNQEIGLMAFKRPGIQHRTWQRAKKKALCRAPEQSARLKQEAEVGWRRGLVLGGGGNRMDTLI